MRARIGIGLCFLLSLAAASPAPSESSVTWGLQAAPEFSIPMGNSAEYYQLGAGARLAVALGLPVFPLVTPFLDLGYLFLPVLAAEESGASLSLIRAGAGGALSVPFGKRFTADVMLSGGYYAGLLHAAESSQGSSFYGVGTAGVSMFLSPRFSLEAAAGYGYFHQVYQGLFFALGTTARLAGKGGGPIPPEGILPLFPGKLPAKGFLKISDAKLKRVFPVLFKYYDTHPLGRVTLSNVGDREVQDLRVRLELQGSMDAPKLSARIERLKKGETTAVELFALFNEKVLEVTEGTKVIAQVTVDYKVAERDARDVETLTIEMYDRNALRWDDDRKIAAFVTAKDDEVLKLAKAAAGVLGGSQWRVVSGNLQKGIVTLAALKELGVTYVVDPSSSYKDLSAKEGAAVDYIQFPRQTLQFKAGDCDDLSATYCALLEAIGVPTAFITVPGHIYSALRLEMPASEARAAFRSSEELILRPDGSAWVPVETTALKEGFLQAWTLGARQWRDSSKAGQAGFFTTEEAWGDYQPVAFNIPGVQASVPAREAMARSFEEQMRRFVEREIAEREQALVQEAKKTQGNQKALNNLGVLYARYGLLDKAAVQFDAALKRGEYVPSLLNQGNLLSLQERPEEALGYYQRALALQPNNPRAALAVARTSHQLGNFGDAKRQYDRLAALDPKLAEQYGYLAQRDQEAARASDAARGGGVLWEE
jgi:tetratricopeptide (TPR) repeat protein